ncbi:hypothetical protein GCM10009077_29070 [Roseibium denhamense]
MAVFFRFTLALLLTSAIWASHLAGLGAALFVLGASIALLMAAARLLPKRSRFILATKQIGYGERIWLNRLLIPVPPEMNRQLTIGFIVSFSGLIAAIIGAFYASMIVSVTGLAVAYTAQIACMRTQRALYRAMKTQHPLYSFWDAEAGNDNKASPKLAGKPSTA